MPDAAGPDRVGRRIGIVSAGIAGRAVGVANRDATLTASVLIVRRFRQEDQVEGRPAGHRGMGVVDGRRMEGHPVAGHHLRSRFEGGGAGWAGGGVVS
jgi:hypothetical protein